MPLRKEIPELSCIALLVCLASPYLASGCATTPSSETQKVATPLALPMRAPPGPWEEMTFEQRKKHMTETVAPVMERVFLEHDGQRFGAFGCSTCHGKDARKTNFAMPSAALPALYPSGTAEQVATVRKHRDMARFMFQRVTPTMRDLLGMPAYDTQTGAGFSCFYCHPRGESTALQAGRASQHL